MSLPHVPVRAHSQEEFNRQLATTVNQLIRSVSAGFSSGDIKGIAGPNIPTGWLLCNGSAQSRIEYPDLYAAIGTTWGAGDGSTTFNLPDLRNRLLVGAGTVALGDYSGASEVTLTTDELPAHSHDLTDPGHTHTFTGTPHGHAVTDPGHSHAVTDPGHTHTEDFVDSAAGTEYVNTAGDKGTAQSAVASGTTGVTVDSATTGLTVDDATAAGTNDSSTTGATVDSAGSGLPFSILPLVAGVQWVIKT